MPIHPECRNEIDALNKQIELQKSQLESQQAFIELLEARLSAIEESVNLHCIRDLSQDEVDDSNGKYDLYEVDSPTNSTLEMALGPSTRSFFPPNYPVIRARAGSVNPLTPTRKMSMFGFGHRNSTFSPNHRTHESISGVLNVGVRSSYSQESGSSVSKEDSPPVTPRKARLLTIDTSAPALHRGSLISSKSVRTEHLLVPGAMSREASLEKQNDSDEEKEFDRKRLPSILRTERETSTPRSPTSLMTTTSNSVTNHFGRPHSISLFRSTGIVSSTCSMSSSGNFASFSDSSFGDYTPEFTRTRPRAPPLITSPTSSVFSNSPPAVIESVRTDQQAYEELKPARNLLIASLGLNGAGIGYDRLERGGEWLERFLFASGQDDLSFRNKLLLEFSKDFIRQATTRARIILQEVHVPIHKKSIPPLKVGGVAGGTKYLDQNILFKFADDPAIGGGKHLYGGVEADHERAGKAAANDLKGADAYFRCFALMGRIPVVVPPQVVMDFNGFRLVAMPWLPLAESRLVYGSGDGGKTVHDDDEVMQAALKFGAHHLHLVKHIVKDKMLYSAGDVEAHVGKDGRRYLVDLARTFPPEDPGCCTHLTSPPSAVFYRLHRTAFMEHLKSKQDHVKFPSLSSDAFSKWGDKQDAPTHNENASQATSYLLTDRIPELVAFLKTQDHMTQNLGQVMQRWGISVRHMGLVRAKARESNATEALIQQLLVNMVARCCKNLLRQDLREAALAKNVNDSIAAFLNALTGCGEGEKEESLMFWGVKLPIDLCRRFGSVALTRAEETILQGLCKPSLGTILKYVLAQTGVTLNADTQAWQQPGFVFDRLSVLSTSVRSKTFSVLEDLLQEDNIVQACECKTRNDFFSAVTKLSRKASEDLAYVLNIISEPEELLKYFQTRAGKKGQNVQLMIMCALALFFSDKPYPEKIRSLIANSTEVWAVILALVPKLPQIFSLTQQHDLMTARMLSLCESESPSTGTDELAQALLSARANPNAKIPETKDPLLHLCALKGQKCLVESLVEAKAELNVLDPFGHSLEQLIFTYSQETTRTVQMIGLKPSPVPPVLLPPVRFRVHSLRAANANGDISSPSASRLPLRLKVKITGGSVKQRQTAVASFVDENNVKCLPVHAEYFFDAWPQDCHIKCTLYRGQKRAASVLIEKHQSGFFHTHAPMKSKSSDMPGLVLIGDILISPPRVPKMVPSPVARETSSLTRRVSGTPAKLYRNNSWSFKPFRASKEKPERSRRSTLDSELFKVIILGTSESGKSALFKRLRGPVLQEDLSRYVDIIRRNVITGVQTLIMASTAKLHALLPVNERSVAYVANFDVYELNPQDVSEVLPHLQAVLSDPGIQRTMLDRTVFQMSDARDRNSWNVNDTADHFFGKLQEIFANDYVPSHLDCLACRVRSVGIVEHKVMSEWAPWRVFDVGGSRNERRKWPNIYEGADAVIFTVNITCYDRVSEDATTNRMLESVMSWETVISCEALSNACFVLLFTFDDKFRQKLQHKNVSKTSFFAELFENDPSPQEAREHISKRFLQHSKLPPNMLKVVFVDLLNDVSYEAAYKEIQQFLCTYAKVVGFAGVETQPSPM